MINYYDIPKELKARIPEFSYEEDFLEMPTVVFTFFAIFLEKNLLGNKGDILQRCVKFLNELCESERNDDNIGYLLDEVFLDVYNSSTNIHDKLFNLLSLEGQKRMALTIYYWRRQENL